MGAVQANLAKRRVSTRSESEKQEEQPIQLHLSNRQKLLLNQSWTGDFDQLYTIGSLIFENLFAKVPAAKKVFATAKNKPVEMLTVEDFDNFFLKFIRLITLSVTNLRQMSMVVDPMLMHIGAMHVRLVDKGFKAELWAAFPEATQAALATVMRSEPRKIAEADWDDTCSAWRCLTDYMVAKMIVGFEAEKTRMIGNSN